MKRLIKARRYKYILPHIKLFSYFIKNEFQCFKTLLIQVVRNRVPVRSRFTVAVRTDYQRSWERVTRAVPSSLAPTRSSAAAPPTTRPRPKATTRMAARRRRLNASHLSMFTYNLVISRHYNLDGEGANLYECSYRFGCCADNETEATGPDSQGCPESGELSTLILYFVH